MNTSESSFPESLIARYLAGEASHAEMREMETWAAESDENEAELAAYKKIWEASNLDSAPRFDSIKAFQKVKIQIQEQGKTEATVVPINPAKNYLIWRIAAGLALLIGIGSILYYFSSNEEVIRIASGNTQKEIKLPDSTLVILKPNSEISYTENFGKNNRNTTLKGEAFFDVVRDVKNPFSIQAGDAHVRVLGTSFSINSNKKEDVSIKVSSGKVLVYDGVHEQASSDSLAVILLPGQEAHFSGEGKSIHTNSTNLESIRFGFDKTLVFENSDLKAVCSVLEKVFGTTIQFKNEETSNCRLTATFKNQDLSSILLIISETFNITVVKEPKSYLLDGPGC